MNHDHDVMCRRNQRAAVQAMLQKQKVREIMADRTVTDVMDKMGLNRSGSATKQQLTEMILDSCHVVSKGGPPQSHVCFLFSKTV